MPEDPPRGGPPPFQPLAGWPEPPEAPPEPDRSDPDADADSQPGWPGRPGERQPWEAAPARPPSAPPPGWTGARPSWAEPPPASPAAPPPGAPSRPGRLAALRSRRGLAIVAAVVALLLLAAGVAVALTSGGDDGGGAGGAGGTASSGGKNGVKAPATAAGTDIPLLDGRLTVVARPGWEKLESSTDTATVRLALPEANGRELLATLIVTALPGGGSLDRILAVDGGTPFEVTTGAGPLKATAVPGIAGRVVAGAVKPSGTFFFSLSVSGIDGLEVDAALLKKLFTEQVAPQLRF